LIQWNAMTKNNGLTRLSNIKYNLMKKFFLLFFGFVMTSLLTNAQDVKKIKQLFGDAEKHLLYEEYELALPLYMDLINENWENANVDFSIGICYLNISGQEKLATPYLEKASQNTTSNFREGNYKEEKAPEETWFYLAKSYRLQNDFQKAIDAYKKFKSTLSVSDVYYLDFVDLQVKTCETAMKMIANPVKIIQDPVSFTADGENYNPAVSGDEKSVVFTSMQLMKEEGEEYFFNILFYSTNDGHEWKKPRDITNDIYSDGYFSTSFLSYAGDFLIMYRDDYGNGNLYFSEQEGRKWSEFQKFPKQIDSKNNETHGSLSKDGNILYFASDRPGGLGGKDIYKSEKDSKGKWGLPVNLGDVINTPFEEDTPFLSEDGKTLYFASEAHASMGGYDIFKSALNDDGTWSEPQNLGYPINTSADNTFYVPIGDGSVAYMAMAPPQGGPKQIFRIEYPKIERVIEVIAETPEATDTLSQSNQVAANETDVNLNESGVNSNETAVTETEQPTVKRVVVPSEYDLMGRLSLQDNKDLDGSFYVHVAKDNGEVVAALSPDLSTGEFKTKLKPGTYRVSAHGTGYKTAEKTLVINNDQQQPEVLTFLTMVPEAVSSGEYFTIKSVLFDYNSDVLNRESQIEIERLAMLMKKNPSLTIEVDGNTDSHGTDVYNKGLSVRRARAVVDYIHNKGVSEDRFVTKGLGNKNYIAINQNPDGSDNPEGRRLNRRVDMKVVNSNNDQITIENIYVPDELRYKDQLTFTILLMETEKPLEPSYFNTSGETISNVWMFTTEKGYLYSVGRFNHKSEALTMMNKVVDAGFPDSRIINSLEYNQLIQNGSNFFKAKISDTDKQVYTIQLLALKKPLDNKGFKGLTEVEEIKGDDGYYRYIWGEFIGKVSAQQALYDVINHGYVDAFVVSMNKYRR